ncbi:MAG: TnpV protein [Eubacterium sp.]|nr:TnpV protein [Eubacterium sp.]
MNKTLSDKNNGLDYTLVNGAYLPNLISTETNYEIGMWGQRHLEYIKKNRRSFYFNLKTSCKLNSYLHKVDIRATEMYDRLVNQLKEQQSITEQLKATDMMAWVQAMNNITNQAREIVNNEVIYNKEGSI